MKPPVRTYRLLATPAGRLAARAAFVAVFLGVDEGLAAALDAAGVVFPSNVSGMVLVFAALLLLHRWRPALVERLRAASGPARTFLGRWLALFFVPPLVNLGLMDGPGGGALAGLVGVAVAGFVFTLATTAVLAGRLRRGGGVPDAALPVAVPPPAGPVLRSWVGVGVAAGGLAALGVPGAATVLFVAVPVAGFVAGVLLQRALVARVLPGAWGDVQRTLAAFVHPVVTGAGATAVALLAVRGTLRGYLTYAWPAAGAGDVLMLLLDPAVVALGFLLFDERRLLAAFRVEIAGTVAAAAMLALASSAVLARLFALPAAFARSVLPRSVTTPIAVPIARSLGADPGLTAAIVVFTGVLGAVAGAWLLDRMGTRHPVVRGVAVGAASHGIGTAALLGTEPSAAAASSVAFALMGLFTSLYLSAAPVRALLLWVAGG